jgi:uncharacterized small protein (DUF1192 family)
VNLLIDELEHQQNREEFLPERLLRRLKLFFLLCCGLGMAALSGWAGFAYKTSSAHRVYDQMVRLAADFDRMKAQRDAALYQLEQLRWPPQNLAEIDARLGALGAEYNRLWELAKTKRSQASKELDFTATGTVRKASPDKQAH